jgi:hypothetical protein
MSLFFFFFFLLALSLLGDSFQRLLQFFLTGQVVALDWLQRVLVQFVDERDSSGNVQLDDLSFRLVVQILDQRSQTVSVSHNQHFLSFSAHKQEGKKLEKKKGRERSHLFLFVVCCLLVEERT